MASLSDRSDGVEFDGVADTMPGPHWRERFVDCFAYCRMASAVVALLTAFAGETGWFVASVAVGLVTDALDGPLSRLLKTASARGARLDSRADLALTSAAVAGLIVLFPDRLVAEWPLVATALFAWALPMAVGWAKFGRLTSYHTLLAQTSLLVIPLALVAWLGFDTLWPLQMSVALLVLSGFEELVITWKLDRPHDDVSHVFCIVSPNLKREATCVSKVSNN
jgi:phosphatidylserine synthase